MGGGYSVVALHLSTWEVESCTIVDDIECDGIFVLQKLPEFVVFANRRLEGGLLMSMIVVQEDSSIDGRSAVVVVWMRSP